MPKRWPTSNARVSDRFGLAFSVVPGHDWTMTDTTESFVRNTHDGLVTTATITRPDKLNALSDEVLRDLETAIVEIEARVAADETRCVILTGEGKAFVAGADIAGMKELDPLQARSFSAYGHRIFARLERLSVPVIAAVNGFALGGGCELALACDFIYASEKAKLGQPEVGLGVTPGFGGTQRLPRRVGIGVARELMYTGRVIRADEAHRIGLVNAVFAPDELMAAAKKCADTIAGQGPVAVAECKRVMNDGEGRPLPDGNALEVDAFGRCFESPQQKQGMTAFLEKRSADF